MTTLADIFLVKEKPFYLGNLVKMSADGHRSFSNYIREEKG
jgi:vancomycin permeability regulator SanA